MLKVKGVTVPVELAHAMPPNHKKRNDKTVKIARDLAIKAKLIAETKGVTIAEYLSDYLRPLIEKDWPKAVRKVDSEGSEPN